MSDSPAFIPSYITSIRRPENARDGRHAGEAAGVEKPDDVDEPEASPRREGLPAHYRMRAEPHYVESLVRNREARTTGQAGPAESVPVTLRPGRATAAAAAALSEAVSSMETSLQELSSRGRSLRERVALELARAEAVRARWLAEAVGVLHREPLPALDEVDLGVVLREVAAAIGPEERLLGGAPRVVPPPERAPVFGDLPLLTVAIGGLVQALSALAGERGDPSRLAVRVVKREGSTRAIELVHSAVRLSASARARLFDAEWADHPAGPIGGLLLASARRIALAQGGSLDVSALEDGGCRLLFSVPAAD